MNGAKDFRGLLTAFGMGGPELEAAETERAAVAEEINGQAETPLLTKLRTALDELQMQLKANDHDLAGARSALGRIRAELTRWDSVKRRGIASLSVEGAARAKQLLAQLESCRIVVVPVGELESWMDLGTRQKRRWVTLALLHVGDGNSSAELREFVGGLIGRKAH